MVTDLTPTLMWEEPGDVDDAVASMIGQSSPFNLSTSYSMGARGSSMHLGSGMGRNASNSRSITSYDLYISLDSLMTDADSILVETNSYTPETELLEDVVYYWKVVATDDDGGQTESAVYSFWTNNMNSAPTAFVLESPDQDEETGQLPTFSWTASTDSDLYDELSYTLGYGVSVSNLTEVATDSLNIIPDDSLLDNTVYYWQVTAEDLSGATYTTAIQSFMVNSANDVPGDFALLFPEDESMVTDLTPTLMWEEPGDVDDAVASMIGQSSPFNLSTSYSMGARGSSMHLGSGMGRNASNSRSITSYDLYISLDSLMTDADSILVETNSYTPETELLEDVVYYWKVVATDDDGGQTESAVHSFWTNNMNSAPGEIILLTPDNESTTGTQPLFSWSESIDEDLYDNIHYTLAYGTDVTSLIHIALDDQLLYSSSDSLLDNTEYFWQVIAEDFSGATFATPLQSFFVNAVNDNPEGFTLLSPDSASIVQGSNQYLIWNPSSDDDGDLIDYEVFLDEQSIGITNHNYIEVRDLVEDATYEWYVVASDSIGGEATSSVWSFTVNTENTPPTEFTLISPTDESLMTTTDITFNWQRSRDLDINDSVSYQLHLDVGDSVHIFQMDDTTYVINNLSDNTIYHWHVLAMDVNGGVTINSEGESMFIINEENNAPSVVTLMAPIEGSTQSVLTPNFSWTDSNDPDPFDNVSYNLSWWEPFSTDIQSVNLDTNGFTPNGYLLDNAIYQWRVQAEDVQGATSFSDTAYFYTDAYAEPPVNFSTISPMPDANMSSTIVNFKWFSTIDPDPNDEITYRIAYSTDWSDTSTYVYTAEIEDTSMSLLLDNNLQYFWVAQAMDKDNFVVSSNYNTPNTFVIGTLSAEEEMIPDEFALHQNFPNPFNPITSIRFDLPTQEKVNIIIFDVMGRNIRSLLNENRNAGYHNIQWDAKNDLGEHVSAGMYIYIIQAGEHRSVKKMVLLK